MADVLQRHADGVIEMNATNNGPTVIRKSGTALPVESIIVSGGTAGEFQVRLNNTTFSIHTGSADLTKQVFVNMPVNEVQLVAQPTGGSAYLILDQMA